MHLSAATRGVTPGHTRELMAQDLLTLVANFKPRFVKFTTQTFFWLVTQLQRAATSVHGDGPITGRFTFLQIQALNAHGIEAIVQFVEKTDVMVNLPTGFGKSLKKFIVCV